MKREILINRAILVMGIFLIAHTVKEDSLLFPIGFFIGVFLLIYYSLCPIEED